MLVLLVWLLAAPPPARAFVRTVQAEQMRARGHGTHVYKDRGASGGRAVRFTTRAPRSLARWRFSATLVTVWADGTACEGAPRVGVRIDGHLALDARVVPGGWKQYGALVHIRGGRHRVQVYLPDPRRTRSCRRTLLVDKLVLSRAAETSTSNWQVVFDDEFNGTQLDATKWSAYNWAAHSKFYDPANALVENGLLRLRASAPNRSAMVQTLGKFAPRYGLIEASIRVPSGQGLWPSFWLKTAQVATVKYPEVDLLEMWMTAPTNDIYDPFTVSQNYHWQGADGRPQSNHSWVFGRTDYSAGFHRFAVEWEPGSIRWFIDGVQTKEVSGPTVSNVPMFLVLSLQIGHAWWLGDTFAPNASTPFPSYLDVDWVRVYQRCGAPGSSPMAPSPLSAPSVNGCMP